MYANTCTLHTHTDTLFCTRTYCGFYLSVELEDILQNESINCVLSVESKHYTYEMTSLSLLPLAFILLHL